MNEFLSNRRNGDGPRLIATPNLDHWRLLSESRAFRSAYNAAAIVLNDSRFMMRALLKDTTTTFPGCELASKMLDDAAPLTRVMVVGCPPPVRVFLQSKRPDLRFELVEPSHGFIFRRAERRTLVQRAERLRPNLIFVCIGAPQSEVFAHQLLRKLTHVCDILCCGAGLQFAAGMKARAPRWLRLAGCEWAWRFVGERHTRLRYVLDVLFLIRKHPALRELSQGGQTRLAGLRVMRPLLAARPPPLPSCDDQADARLGNLDAFEQRSKRSDCARYPLDDAKGSSSLHHFARS